MRSREDRLEMYEESERLVGYVLSASVPGLPANVERDDLQQACCEALWKATEGYNEARNSGFTHYALLKMRWAVKDHLREHDTASSRMRRFYNKRQKALRRFCNREGRRPCNRELAEEMELSIDKFHKEVHTLRAQILFLSDPGRGLIEEAVAEGMRAESLAVMAERRNIVDRLKSRLTHMEGQVLECMQQGYGTREASVALMVHETRISQIKKQLSNKLERYIIRENYNG